MKEAATRIEAVSVVEVAAAVIEADVEDSEETMEVEEEEAMVVDEEEATMEEEEAVAEDTVVDAEVDTVEEAVGIELFSRCNVFFFHCTTKTLNSGITSTNLNQFQFECLPSNSFMCSY